MKYLCSFLLILFATATYAQQAPSIVWQKALGGTELDIEPNIVYTEDGMLWICAFAVSKDIDVIQAKGKFGCFWFLNMDTTGVLYNTSCYGAAHAATPSGIARSGSGFILAGEAVNGGDDVTSTKGLYDYWGVKVDKQGNKLWDSTYGGSLREYAMAITGTKDGGCLYTGTSGSYDGSVDTLSRKSLNNIWVVKTDSVGVLEWQSFFGDSLSSYTINSVIQQTTGDYIFCGVSNNSEMLIAKLDSVGNEKWVKIYGSPHHDISADIIATRDDGFVVVGSVEGDGGDVHHHIGKMDVWLVKLDSTGNIKWEKTYGGSNNDYGRQVVECQEGGYLFVGSTFSNDIDVQGNHAQGSCDGWVVKVDDTGKIEWQKCLGGTDNDFISEVIQLQSGSYILGGYSQSSNGDLTSNNGNADIWVLQLRDVINIGVNDQVYSNEFSIYPNPANDKVMVSINSADKGELALIDMQGRALAIQALNGQVKQYSFDVSGMPAGNYYIRITIDDKELTKPLTIVR